MAKVLLVCWWLVSIWPTVVPKEVVVNDRIGSKSKSDFAKSKFARFQGEDELFMEATSAASNGVSMLEGGANDTRSVVLPLKGGISTLGEYYTELDLGGQVVRVQVDTGSSSLIVTSSNCFTCMRNDKVGGVYSVNKSSTGKDISCASDLCGTNSCSSFNCKSTTCSADSNACCSETDPSACGFYLDYGGDTEYHVSAQGVVVQDTVKIGDLEIPEAIFYRTTKEAGPWPSKVDGILGLGFPRLNCNPSCYEPVYMKILNQIEAPHTFSLCMGDRSGVLALGTDGVKENMVVGGIHYIPVLTTTFFGTYYTIGMTSMMVGPEELADTTGGGGTPPRQAIVDSGTTMLLLEKALWDSLIEYFQTHFCRLPGVCTTPSVFTPGVCLTSPPHGFPMISFNLVGGLRLQMPPSLYFIRYLDPEHQQYVYCFGIQQAGNERTVFGDTIMRGFHVVFDTDSREIGFALPNRTTCGEIELKSFGGKPSLHRTPAFANGESLTTQAIGLSLGAIGVVSAIFAQVLVCMRATKKIRNHPYQQPPPFHKPYKLKPRRLSSKTSSGFGTFSVNE